MLITFLWVWVVGWGWLAGIIHCASMYIFFYLLDMFEFARKCMGEGGGTVAQTILGRNNVPSLKKSKMSRGAKTGNFGSF